MGQCSQSMNSIWQCRGRIVSQMMNWVDTALWQTMPNVCRIEWWLFRARFSSKLDQSRYNSMRNKKCVVLCSTFVITLGSIVIALACSIWNGTQAISPVRIDFRANNANLIVRLVMGMWWLDECVGGGGSSLGHWAGWIQHHHWCPNCHCGNWIWLLPALFLLHSLFVLSLSSRSYCLRWDAVSILTPSPNCVDCLCQWKVIFTCWCQVWSGVDTKALLTTILDSSPTPLWSTIMANL